MRWLMQILVVVLAAAVIGLYVRLHRLEVAQAAHQGPAGKAAQAVVEEEHVEVAVYMQHLQHYAHKLWASGNAGNLPLAQFYLEEIEETLEELERQHVVDEGKDLSALARQYGLPAVEALEQQLMSEGLTDFAGNYQGLVTGCNACHAASGHAIIQVKAPTANRYSDQVFEP